MFKISDISKVVSYSVLNDFWYFRLLRVKMEDETQPKSSEFTLIQQDTCDKTFKCNNCNAIFQTYSAILSHKINVHNFIYECTICDRRFREEAILQKHVKTCSPEKYYCEVCNKDVRSSASLRKHRRHHKAYPGLACCGRMFSTDASYQTHIENAHTDQYVCEVCAKIFKKKNSYYCHRRVHSEEYVTPRICPICQKRFRGSYGLKYHVESVHEGKRVLCEICGKEMRSELHLKKHLQVHSGEKPFICGFCTKRFARNDTLTLHLRVHTRERPYVCEICNKRFSQKSSLNLHVKSIHQENKRHSCVICNKSFVNRAGLKGHMQQHSTCD